MSWGLGLVVRFTVKPGHQDAFDQLVADTLADIQTAEPGTLVYASHEVASDPQLRIFYELYVDRAAFDAHEQQPHVRRFLTEREQHLDSVQVDFLTAIAAKGIPGAEQRGRHA